MRRNFGPRQIRSQDIYSNVIQASHLQSHLIQISHLQSIIIQASHLRAGIINQSHLLAALILSAQPSQLIHLRQTWQINSLGGAVQSFSLDGYGHPDWVMIERASVHDTAAFAYRVSWNDAVSLIYVSLFYTGSFGSLAATVSYAMRITALVASR